MAAGQDLEEVCVRTAEGRVAPPETAGPHPWDLGTLPNRERGLCRGHQGKDLKMARITWAIPGHNHKHPSERGRERCAGQEAGSEGPAGAQNSQQPWGALGPTDVWVLAQ